MFIVLSRIDSKYRAGYVIRHRPGFSLRPTQHCDAMASALLALLLKLLRLQHVALGHVIGEDMHLSLEDKKGCSFIRP